VQAYQPGQELDVGALLKEGETVDVAGVTVGKGFQGACAPSSAMHVANTRPMCCMQTMLRCAQAPSSAGTTSAVR
jgi:ribosomal protein L3